MKKVIIVGSGVSGLAAAAKLCSAGYVVQILEQGSHPGGRTYSFREKQSGDVVDNGQHILLDCYANTLKYLSIIGAGKFIETEPELKLTFVHPERGTARVRISAKGPPRAALLTGLAGYSFLSFSDRLKLLKVGHQLYTATESYLNTISGLTVEEWLRKSKQSQTVKKCFWYPLAIAIMNESLNRASAEVFVRTMKIAVFDTKGPSKILTPLRGLTEVFIDPAVTFISKNGGRIDCNKRVIGIDHNDRLVKGVSLSTGDTVAGDAYILTGQPVHIHPLLESAGVQFHHDVSYVPIITCNIWFDREVELPPRTGMIDSEFHWVFKKDASFAESEGNGYVSLVMSGAREHVGMSGEALLNLALRELRSCFPTLRDANVTSSRVIKERRATVSITPEIQKKRPGNKTRFDNVYIAGDWTQTELPATIEGAIMSGFRAAGYVMEGRW
jgi:hydroxysqualene dehydroxylase